jgi:hypothetical protein
MGWENSHRFVPKPNVDSLLQTMVVGQFENKFLPAIKESVCFFTIFIIFIMTKTHLKNIKGICSSSPKMVLFNGTLTRHSRDTHGTLSGHVFGKHVG